MRVERKKNKCYSEESVGNNIEQGYYHSGRSRFKLIKGTVTYNDATALSSRLDAEQLLSEQFSRVFTT